MVLNQVQAAADCRMEGRKQLGSEMEVPEAGLAVEKPQGTLIVETLMHV